MLSYFSLFTAALLAATLVPAQSEALLVGLLLKTTEPAWALWLTATIGNSLGSCINWFLGRYIERFKDKHWFPIKANTLARAQQFYQKFGYASVLLSWVPIIGDPITVIAGLMRMPFLYFVILTIIAKGGRYAVLVYVTVGMN